MESKFRAYYKSKVAILEDDVSVDSIKKAIQSYGGEALKELEVEDIGGKEFIVEFVEETIDYDEPTEIVADVIIDSALFDAGFDDFECELLDFHYKEEASFDEY